MSAFADQNVIDIIEYDSTTGQLRVYPEHIRVVTDKAPQRSQCSVISVIGDTQCGKSTLMNLLIDYYDSADKNRWPGNGTLTRHCFETDQSSDVPTKLVQIYGQPIVLIDEDDPENSESQLTILLIDTQHIFNWNKPDQVMWDVANYLFQVSSTILLVSMGTIKDEFVPSLKSNINDYDKFDNNNKIIHVILECEDQVSITKFARRNSSKMESQYRCMPVSAIDKLSNNIQFKSLLPAFKNKLRDFFMCNLGNIYELEKLNAQGNLVVANQLAEIIMNSTTLLTSGIPNQSSSLENDIENEALTREPSKTLFHVENLDGPIEIHYLLAPTMPSKDSEDSSPARPRAPPPPTKQTSTPPSIPPWPNHSSGTSATPFSQPPPQPLPSQSYGISMEPPPPPPPFPIVAVESLINQGTANDCNGNKQDKTNRTKTPNIKINTAPSFADELRKKVEQRKEQATSEKKEPKPAPKPDDVNDFGRAIQNALQNKFAALHPPSDKETSDTEDTDDFDDN